MFDFLRDFFNIHVPISFKCSFKFRFKCHYLQLNEFWMFSIVLQNLYKREFPSSGMGVSTNVKNDFLIFVVINFLDHIFLTYKGW